MYDHLEGGGGGGEAGGGFKREETHVYLWLIYIDVWKKLSQYCKVIILQFKKMQRKNIYYLRDLEARSPRSSCQQGCAPFGGVREGSGPGPSPRLLCCLGL